jgi:hypothetical protein
MPAPDRLPELLHQRALLREHLAWLDRQIAQASGGEQRPATTPGDVVNPKPTAPVRAAPSSVAAGEASLPAADEILEQYRVAPNALQTDVKKGCLLYFAGAFVLLALAIVAFYFLNRRV